MSFGLVFQQDSLQSVIFFPHNKYQNPHDELLSQLILMSYLLTSLFWFSNFNKFEATLSQIDFVMLLLK